VGKTLVEDAVAVSEVLPFSYRFLHPNFLWILGHVGRYVSHISNTWTTKNNLSETNGNVW
jgi:hypothetical protein